MRALNEETARTKPCKDAFMSNNQLFAKIGVFVLLGLNVGAYYVFWPGHDSGLKSEAKAPKEEKGTAQLLPAQPTIAKPKEIAPAALASATLLNPAASPKTIEVSPDEAVSKLLEHIKKETEAENKPSVPKAFDEKAFVVPEPQEIPPKKVEFPDDPRPKTLPPLKGEPLAPEGSNSNNGLTPANGTAGVWLLHTEIVGGQTLLTARLRQPSRQPVEFRVACDRVDTKGPGGDVQAIGKVTFVGPGLKGTCQHLTIAIFATRILFEEQVVLVQDGVGSTWRADRIGWELPIDMPPTGSK
jgi:hypothetical protein